MYEVICCFSPCPTVFAASSSVWIIEVQTKQMFQNSAKYSFRVGRSWNNHKWCSKSVAGKNGHFELKASPSQLQASRPRHTVAVLHLFQLLPSGFGGRHGIKAIPRPWGVLS